MAFRTGLPARRDPLRRAWPRRLGGALCGVALGRGGLASPAILRLRAVAVAQLVEPRVVVPVVVGSNPIRHPFASLGDVGSRPAKPAFAAALRRWREDPSSSSRVRTSFLYCPRFSGSAPFPAPPQE